MWAFRQFPDTIQYTPSGEDRPTYQVEVFGFLNLIGGVCLNVTLVAFRERGYWVAGQDEISNVQFLPQDEFIKKFKKFRLIEI